MQLKAVISDLDGVIVNSEHYHFLSFKQMMNQDYGVEYGKAEDQYFIGTTDVFVFETLKKKYPQITDPIDALIKKRTEYYIEIFQAEANPLPGIFEFFDYLKQQNIPVVLGTNASRGVVEFIFKCLHLEKYMQFYMCANDVKEGKPSPELFLALAKKLNEDPINMLVIEDSVHGVSAAKAAGMKCIAIPCGPTIEQDHSQADLILKSATELTPANLQSVFQ